MHALYNTVSLPTRYTCKISLAFQQKKALVSSLHSLIHCFLQVAVEALVEISSSFSTHPTNSAFLCFCLFVVVFKSSPQNMFIYSEGGGERNIASHMCPNQNHGMPLQTTEPPGQGCPSCVFVSPPFLLLSEANTVFLKF